MNNKQRFTVLVLLTLFQAANTIWMYNVDDSGVIYGFAAAVLGWVLALTMVSFREL